MKLKKLFTLMAVAGITLPGVAMATNGMFASGYGMVAAGMGGAATAMSEDAFGGANNPASMVFVGDRIDFGASLFSPKREATSADFGAGGPPFASTTIQSDKDYFVVPEFGYNKMMSKDLSLGVTVYGNGGMNTDYAAGSNNINMYGNTGRLGVDLVQLVIAPTAAYKIAPNHSIGISPLIGYQRFKADGVLSDGTGNSINPGYSDAFGYGVRIGYMGKLTSDLTVGASYSSKVKMGSLSNYSNNLFSSANGGNGTLDLAENYSLGVAYKVMPDLTVALDYMRINYGDVASIGTATTLGGFGWHDIDVWKLGAEYKYNKNWTMRAGWNHGDNPIHSVDTNSTFINIIAPGVVKDHLTMGTTYVTSTGGELTFAYTHGFENSVSAPNPVGGTTTISMHQDILGVAYGWKM